MGSSPEQREYDDLARAFDDIREALPAIDGWRIHAKALVDGLSRSAERSSRRVRPPTSRLRQARWRAAHERACSAGGPGAERAAQFRRSHPELPLTGYEGDGIHAGNQEELRWQSAAQLTPC
jgi:hypothetical protein